jgi:hypothetical protein
VLVKVSYFPNWDVSGAEGPYRIGPNMMVVVPTSNEVHLMFGRSGVDVLAYLLTLAGLLLLVFWRWRGDVQHLTASPIEPRVVDDTGLDDTGLDEFAAAADEPFGDADAPSGTFPPLEPPGRL